MYRPQGQPNKYYFICSPQCVIGIVFITSRAHSESSKGRPGFLQRSKISVKMKLAATYLPLHKIAASLNKPLLRLIWRRH